MNRVPLGPVHHFALAVVDPNASATWWSKNFDLDELFRFEGGVFIGNGAFAIVLMAGHPLPVPLRHMAFRMTDLASLQAACDVLIANGVALEDPGNEIGPTSPGSAHMGLWFRDLDGYRWELFVEGPPSA